MQLGLGRNIFFAQDLEDLQLLNTFREIYEINLLFRLGYIYIYTYTCGTKKFPELFKKLILSICTSLKL